MHLLELTDVTVAYGTVKAVRRLSLYVEQGEIVGLIGPNGAGKSTTLHAITGVVRPLEGEIRLDGKRIDGLPPEAIVRLGISLVPEARHIFSRLSVQDNLQLGTTTRKDRRQARTDVTRMMERFPALGRLRTQQAGRLSGGEQQQLAIARALLSRPSLLLLDEPSLGLAPLLVTEVFNLVDELRRDGTTLLLVEQVVERTVALADRTYLMQKGAAVFQGSAAEYQKAPRLGIDYLHSPSGLA